MATSYIQPTGVFKTEHPNVNAALKRSPCTGQLHFEQQMDRPRSGGCFWCAPRRLDSNSTNQGLGTPFTNAGDKTIEVLTEKRSHLGTTVHSQMLSHSGSFAWLKARQLRCRRGLQ